MQPARSLSFNKYTFLLLSLSIVKLFIIETQASFFSHQKLTFYQWGIGDGVVCGNAGHRVVQGQVTTSVASNH
jgi:hypothetical protein